MPYSFYASNDYKEKQSQIAKTNWQQGAYQHRIKTLVSHTCKNQDCQKTFYTKPYDPKMFCCCSCASHTHNLGRKLSPLTKLRISKAISSLPKSYQIRRKVPRVTLICQRCKAKFQVLPYLVKRRKYCSPSCAIKTIGSMTTSPKASKGKSGIRFDISPYICFYSTWEANMARIYNQVGLIWEYAPKTFDLGEHTYKPDFYLPTHETYVEVKNYLGGYSLERDKAFRHKFPKIKLDLILKKDYLEIKSNYKDLVEHWEY